MTSEAGFTVGGDRVCETKPIVGRGLGSRIDGGKPATDNRACLRNKANLEGSRNEGRIVRNKANPGAGQDCFRRFGASEDARPAVRNKANGRPRHGERGVKQG